MTAPQTVVVADDDATIRTVLVRMLNDDGIRVVTAPDGLTARDLIAEVNPDLILLDVIMPGLSGIELCRLLKSNQPTRLTPVVLITGLDARDHRITGIEAGADDFITKPFDWAELVGRVRSLLRMKRYTDDLEEAGAVLMALGRTIEERDRYTLGHCQRLARFASALGRRLQHTDDRITDLERAGYLHDIGKITIPDAVLQKPGKLTADEWTLVRDHPAAGERICAGVRTLGSVLPIIRHHHERLDGSGYPDGLKGESIPLGAQILQVVDIYDALTTDRPYRTAISMEQALAVLKSEMARGWYDREIFAEFRAMILAGDDADS